MSGAETTSGSQLEVAIQRAVDAGTLELEALRRLVAKVSERCDHTVARLQRGEADQSRHDGFTAMITSTRADLERRLATADATAATFNIVLFGRTGAGKSTLLSALGRLDGSLVSPGESDWTTDVQPVSWSQCLLYDTPGINGWGRTVNRPDLEQRARDAVEQADVVLLCFDSQSQQASEFVKVAAWVQAYGKPAIAVFNERNSRWRQSALVADREARQRLSASVRQHESNIRGELDAIGLTATPVVAISAKMALFARAATPFRGPAARELDVVRERFSREYLEETSNLAVLEELIAASIETGGTDLRLAALREGIRASLLEWVEGIDQLLSDTTDTLAVTERSIAAMLNILGYPDEAQRRAHLHPSRRAKDLLTQLETARAQTFDAPVTGRLDRHIGQLLSSHLAPARAAAHAYAEGLIFNSFADKRTVDEDEFRAVVFQEEEIAQAVAKVAERVNGFLNRELKLAGAEASLDLSHLGDVRAGVAGRAGQGHKATAAALRGGALLVDGAAIALTVIATTNFWNPAGWTAGLILGGLGLVSLVSKWFGKRASRKAEEVKVRARAKVLAEACQAVNDCFDQVAEAQQQQLQGHAWNEAAFSLHQLVCHALDLHRGLRELDQLARALKREAKRIAASPSSDTVLRRAVRALREATPQKVSERQLLLGEDWIEVGEDVVVPPPPQHLEVHARMAQADQDALTSFLARLGAAEREKRLQVWCDRATTLSAEPLVHDLIAGIRRADTEPFTLTLVGDYSSGKSTLIKRLLVEFNGSFDEHDTPRDERLVVGAGPATAQVRSYDGGDLVLIDTPGLQSNRPADATKALEAVSTTSLLVVVLHVNLLVGETDTLLEMLNRAGQFEAGQFENHPAALFLIGRSDELGTDPELDPTDFASRRRRKQHELLSLLATLNIQALEDQIHVISADPFAFVADRSPVTAADYAHSREWDGTAPLVSALQQLTTQTKRSLRVLSAGNHARSKLSRQVVTVQTDLDTTKAAMYDVDQLTSALHTARQEIAALSTGLIEQVNRVVNDHAHQLLAEATEVEADAHTIHATAKALATWWEDPRLSAAIGGLEKKAEKEINAWAANNSSLIGRKVERVGLQRTHTSANHLKADNLKTDRPGKTSSEAIDISAKIAKALGNREAVYNIGKRAGVKFKPWGAVKGGARVARAGAILGAVGAALDFRAWVIEVQDEGKREEARREAAQLISRQVNEVVEQILGGTDKDPGPGRYLDLCDHDLADDHEIVAAKLLALQRHREAAEAQHRSYSELLQHYDDLALGKAITP